MLDLLEAILIVLAMIVLFVTSIKFTQRYFDCVNAYSSRRESKKEIGKRVFKECAYVNVAVWIGSVVVYKGFELYFAKMVF